MTMHTEDGPLAICISTRYHGATFNKPGRIIAQARGIRVTWNYDHAFDPFDNHSLAAQLLADKLRTRPARQRRVSFAVRFAAHFERDDRRGYGFILIQPRTDDTDA